MIGTFRFADVTVQLKTTYSYVLEYCQAYACEGLPDLRIATTQADIDFERKKTAREDEAQGTSDSRFTDPCLETLAVYRRIAEKMPEYDTVLIHGSCVSVDGTAFLFTAKSGTGKSTHTRLWRELLGERAVMVNDDKPLLRVNADGSAIVYGTPWDGKHHLSCNTAVPLKAICILERGTENRIREITKTEALPILIQQTYRPEDPLALAKTLTLIDRLDAKLFRLSCNMDIRAAELSYRTMRGINT